MPPAWVLVNAAVGIWTAIGGIATAVTTAFGAAVAFLTSPIGIVITAIGLLIAAFQLLMKYCEPFSNFINNLFGGTKKASFNVSSQSTISTTASGSDFGGSGRKFEIPPLATGAVIPPNKPFLAELGDQRNGANLEGPESLFRKIVREESGGSEDSMILREIRDLLAKGQTVVLDTGEMVGAVTRGQRKDARRYGY